MIYVINLVFEMAIGLLLFRKYSLVGFERFDSRQKTNRKTYVAVCGLIWILIASLRSLSVGADTYSYYFSFERVKQESLGSLLERVYQKYVLMMSVKDPGYDVFVKIFQFFSRDYQCYLFFIACLFMIPFCIWVYKESLNPVVSFTLYSCLFYAFFSITGIRQTIATVMVVLLGDRLIKEKKLFPFVLLILFASVFHASALIFLPFYFISRIKINRRNIAIWIVLIIVAAFAKSTLKDLYISLSGYDDYAKNYEGAGTLVFSTIMVLLFIWSIISQLSGRILNENARFYNAFNMAMFFLPLTWLNPSAMRIVQYFSLYLVLLIPEMLYTSISKRSKPVATFIILSMFLLLLIRSNPVYSFWWS